MHHPLFTWTAVIMLAGASWWLARDHKPDDSSPIVREGPREVDYYLRRLRATTMDNNGLPARTLTVQELRHFPDDDTTGLTEPRLTVHQDRKPPWEILSDSGWVSSDGALVLLNGKVHITREEGDDTRPVRIDTRNLRVQPYADYAETDEKVRVRSRKDRIDATGMQAWFRSPARIKFLADVKGYYAPP